MNEVSLNQLLNLQQNIQDDILDWVEIVRKSDNEDIEKILSVAPPSEIITRNFQNFVSSNGIGNSIDKIIDDTKDDVDYAGETDENDEEVELMGPNEGLAGLEDVDTAEEEFKKNLENDEGEKAEAESPDSPPTPGGVQEKKGEWAEPEASEPEAPEFEAPEFDNSSEWESLELSDVNGVGEKTEENIRNKFGMPEDILAAGTEGLQDVDGVGKSTAESVINKLKSYYDKTSEEDSNSDSNTDSNKTNENLSDESDENVDESELQFASDDGFYEQDEEALDEYSSDPAKEEEPDVIDDRQHNPDIAEIAQNNDMSEEEVEELQKFA